MEREPRPPEVKQAIDDSVPTLEHSSTCRDTNCRARPNCTTMKLNMGHSKLYCHIGKTNCLACRALVSLSYDHNKGCSDIRCDVPFCNIIKVQLLKCRLYTVQTRLSTAQPRAVFEFIHLPAEHQPPTERQASPMDVDELEMPPLNAFPKLNPNQMFQPRNDGSLLILTPEQDASTNRVYQRRVCHGRRTRAAPADAPAPQDPKPDEGAGSLPNTGSGPQVPQPPRIPVKKATYIWVSKMLYTCKTSN